MERTKKSRSSALVLSLVLVAGAACSTTTTTNSGAIGGDYWRDHTQYFSVEATGKLINQKGEELGLDGIGHWGWWELTVRISAQRKWVGSSGYGIAEQDGTIALGLPRGVEFVPEDKGLYTSTCEAEIWVE